MFYYISKLVWFLIQPSSFFTLIILTGVVACATARGIVWGRRLLVVGVLLLLLGGLSPLANLFMLPLENRVARADLPAQANVTGIIILGGAENGRVSRARGAMAMNEAGERITEAVLLAKRFPGAKVVWSGGAGQMFREEKSGAPSVAQFLQAAGVAKDRIAIEERSRNTHENAKFSKDLLRPQAGERWLLVTSAFHMPRALGCFRRQGFEILPWPADYRTKDAGDLLRPFDSIAKGLKRLDVAAKEWLGLLVYRLTDRTDALLPR